MTVEEFANSIENFNELKPSNKLELFGLFLIKSGQEDFTAKEIKNCFDELRQLAYSNINQYLRKNSNKEKRRGKKSKIKFLTTKRGYQFEGIYQKSIEQELSLDEGKLIEFKVDTNKLDWKPNDIPFVNNKIKSNAHFFTKLYFLFYHLENAIRNLLFQRLSKSHGTEWEKKVISDLDLTKAQSIRKEVKLSEMLPKRGDNILYYCLWDDYAKMLIHYPAIINDKNERDSIVAHLNTLTKMRNAIAHNAATIPKEYQEELSVFLNKFIRTMKKYES